MENLTNEQINSISGAKASLAQPATVGGLGGFGAGMSIGASIGLVGGPAGALVGGLIGGMLGTVGGAYTAITMSY